MSTKLRAAITLVAAGFCGCASPPPAQDPLLAAQEAHRQAFGDFDLPHRIGTVDNVGLQLPAVSPDGQQMLYLRTDQDSVSLMTVLGSDSPEDMPRRGLLSIWLRPVKGVDPGRRISKGRWSHSMVWSASSSTIAYVSTEEKGTSIACQNLVSQEEVHLGVPGQVNVMPRFGPDESTLLYCAGPAAAGPFRVYRQTIGKAPVPLTPEGDDCVLPIVLEDDGTVFCGQLADGALGWVRGRPEGLAQIASPVGDGTRPGFLQVFAGINDALSPDGAMVLYYDSGQNRVAVCDLRQRVTRLHRAGSIAACWLSPNVAALATLDGVFCVNVENGISLPLMSGAWIPARYVRDERRLILLGKERSSTRLTVFEMIFRRSGSPPGKEAH